MKKCRSAKMGGMAKWRAKRLRSYKKTKSTNISKIVLNLRGRRTSFTKGYGFTIVDFDDVAYTYNVDFTHGGNTGDILYDQPTMDLFLGGTMDELQGIVGINSNGTIEIDAVGENINNIKNITFIGRDDIDSTWVGFTVIGNEGDVLFSETDEGALGLLDKYIGVDLR